MRVVSGSRKGTPLKSLPGDLTRPTSDKVKESIFNMIGPYFDGGITVELFGGSGSLSIESLSRGVDEAYIFEKIQKPAPSSVRILKNAVSPIKCMSFEMMQGTLFVQCRQTFK